MDKYLKLIGDALRQDSPPLEALPASSEEPRLAPTADATAPPAEWRQGVTPNSRNPLISNAVRAVIEGIESDARAKGWPAELLWNSSFWDCPRGMASLLDDGDVIAEVTPDFITIVKTERSIVRFQRTVS